MAGIALICIYLISKTNIGKKKSRYFVYVRRLINGERYFLTSYLLAVKHKANRYSIYPAKVFIECAENCEAILKISIRNAFKNV